MMQYITEEEVVEHLTMPKCIELVEQSFRMLADGSAVNHPRRRVILPTGSVLHYMAAGTPGYFGIKIYSTNPKSGAHFQFTLYRSADGMPLANFQANRLGQIRTGASSGVATKFLAREDANTLGVIGGGFQAETQVEAILAVRPIKELRVYSRKPEKRQAFAERCASRLGINARAVDSAQEAVAGMSIVITATSSREPVLESKWIAPGTHINAMGVNWLNKRELPEDLIYDRADLVTVDSIEDAHLESGDLMIPVQQSGRTLNAIELFDVITTRHAGRTNPAQITIFKSNGLAVQDVVSAAYVWGKLYS